MLKKMFHFFLLSSVILLVLTVSEIVSANAEITKIVAPLDSLYVNSGFIPNRYITWDGGSSSWSHLATDYSAYEGQPVMSIADGIVKEKGYTNDCGNYVVIEHKINGVTAWSRYQHFSKEAIVSIGQSVTAGQMIGTAGHSGTGSGNHLHIQIFSGSYPQYIAYDRSNFSGYALNAAVDGPITFRGTTWWNPHRVITGLDIIGNISADKLEFREVVYPKSFKIDTRYGWYLQGGMIVSNVNLTSIRSIIRRVSDGKDIDDTGDIGISGKSYAIKSIDARVRFSLIDTAGKYAWILIAKDSAGKELRMVMYFEAVTSGTTSTEKRSILNGISDSWPDEYNDDIITPPSSPVYGDTSGSTTFWVRADKANASFVLKSYQGKASVAQHDFLGIPTGDGDEIHYGFFWVSDSTGRSFHWGPDATANKSQLNTNQEISMTFPNPGVYSVTVVPLAYSDVNHYWVMDTINYWKTQAKWIVKSDSLSGCKVSFEKLKEVTISFDAGNGVPSGKLPKGQPFDLGGIVKASENIKSVTGTIYDVNTKKAVSGIGTNPVTIYPNKTSVDIYYSDINYSLIFDRLNDGVYRYELWVETVSGWTKSVANSTFTIGKSGGVRGDADGNGVFSFDDILLMVNYYCGLNVNIVASNCDLNGNGKACDFDDILAAIDLYCK